MINDVHRFRRRLHNVKRAKSVNRDKLAELVAGLSDDIEASIAVAAERQKNLPVIEYPDALPIAQKSELIKNTIIESP